MDVGDSHEQADKSIGLANKSVARVIQERQFKNPDFRIVLAESEDQLLLLEFCDSLKGLSTGDSSRFIHKFWEHSLIDKEWVSYQGGTESTIDWGGRSQVLRWENGNGSLVNSPTCYVKGAKAWGRNGISVNQINLAATIYTGEMFDENAASIIANDPQTLVAIWTFIQSKDYHDEVRSIDEALKITNRTMLKVPFDLDHWKKVATEKYPHGLPKPFSSDPTQWLFNGHPAGADQPLHVAVARLLGYQWPRQTGSGFPDCPALGPDGLETLADEDGIVCLAPVRGEASAVERLRKLLAAAFGDEWSAARVRELLLATAVDNNARNADPDIETWLRNSFFSEHCKLFHSRPFILQIWDGNPNGFSALVNYHKLAAPAGEGRKTLDQLTFTYLGDWIDRQKDDQAKGINGADDRLAAALDLQTQLKKILTGEPPYDIFVRWKPLHQQAIGWDPDINDGVRLNIRPFLNAQLRKGGKAGAGILRAKPGTIKWAKDRGKEPMRAKEDFPWFWGWEENDPAMPPPDQALCPNFGAPPDIVADQGQKPRYLPFPAGDSFDGNRWNDLHYSRAAKESARARHREAQA
jgi:hypothetical protein